jgi:hypothetical protein
MKVTFCQGVKLPQIYNREAGENRSYYKTVNKEIIVLFILLVM